VDVPAGLNADTGLPQGTAIRATCTLTLAAPKAGLLQASAIPFVGRLELAPDIGLVKCPVSSDLQWILADDFEGFPPPRSVSGHKGTYGHLVIVAGSLGYHGAAVLAARGALRAQPGLVTLRVSEPVYLPIAAQLQSAMVHPWQPNLPLPISTTALLFGPGLAAPDLPETLRSELAQAWKELPLPMVVDASALDWLPAGRIKSKAARILTPHPGETARMLGCEVATLLGDRPGALRELSKRYGNAWIVLKGHQTLVGRSNGEVYFNSSGNPWLAQGGSGDVLAGYLAGFLAQPELSAHTSLAIRHAVWQHGATSDRLTTNHPTWTIENLVDELGSHRPGAPPPACRLEDHHRRIAL
jgi:ADP-dependent NAD(P)H-hydrate dehydratase / NAD(P)H-hydrate epimerase